MKITEAMILVNQLDEKIGKATEEMEMIIDLMEIPKYNNSQSLSARFSVLTSKTKEWIKERAFYRAQINFYDEYLTIEAYEKISIRR